MSIPSRPHCARLSWTAALLIAFWLCACGRWPDSADNAADAAVSTPDAVGEDLSDASDGVTDAAEVSLGAKSDSSGADASAQQDAFVPTADSGRAPPTGCTGSSKRGRSNSCPGQQGCECMDDDDCDNCKCLQYTDSRRCAQSCVDHCDEPSTKCTLADQPTKGYAFCLPQWLSLCDPCGASTACAHATDATARCVNWGEAGSFCGASCVTTEDCPKGYGCKTGVDVEGKDVLQCRPTDGAACVCSKLAKQKSLSTTCGPPGPCAGSRGCGNDGQLTSCVPLPGAPTLCGSAGQ